MAPAAGLVSIPSRRASVAKLLLISRLKLNQRAFDSKQQNLRAKPLVKLIPGYDLRQAVESLNTDSTRHYGLSHYGKWRF